MNNNSQDQDSKPKNIESFDFMLQYDTNEEHTKRIDENYCKEDHNRYHSNKNSPKPQNNQIIEKKSAQLRHRKKSMYVT